MEIEDFVSDGKWLEMRQNSENFDDETSGLKTYVFSIEGHRGRYHLTKLLPYYGTAFCEKFARAWGQSLMFETHQTSYNYFKATRQCFLWVARRALMEASSPESRVMLYFQNLSTHEMAEKDWRQVVQNVSGSITNLDDKSFVDTLLPSTRNKNLEALRAGLERLANQKLVPLVLPEGRLEDRGINAPKCLATLAYEANRLVLEGLSAKDAYEAFSQKNNEMLEELRRLLWGELKDNYDHFQKGQKLIEECSIDITQIANAINSCNIKDIKKGTVSKLLALKNGDHLGLALKLRRHRMQGGEIEVPHYKLLAFIGPIISPKHAQPYIEATTLALNAAYHIIMIDTAANAQTLAGIPFDLYKGAVRSGRRHIRSIRNSKNRSNGKSVPMNLIEEDIQLSTKSTPDRPSGIRIVEIWKILTEPMRDSSGPTAEMLWLWRTPWETKVKTDLVSMASDRLPAFLERHKDNPLIGGLPITGPIIRKAVANTRGDRNEIDIIIQKAVLGHANVGTTFQYLSEGAVRAFLNSQIRDFVNSWEAVAVTGIDNAARQLGVAESELFRREQLGLENGLDFAALLAEPSEMPPVDNDLAVLDLAKTFSVSDHSMTSLELARRALWSQFEAMVNLNPMRFMRVWVPWMAIVESYSERLQGSRFRVRFKRCCDQLDKKIADGELRLPILW